MKKEIVFAPEHKVETLTDEFVDFKGIKRKFTLCAASYKTDELYDLCTFDFASEKITCNNEAAFENDALVNESFEKVLYLGIAVQRPDDVFNETLGKMIAYGKALKLRDRAIAVTHPGMINTKVVQALLEQEAEYFKKNPGSYLKGYDADKAKYEKFISTLQDPVSVENTSIDKSTNEKS